MKSILLLLLTGLLLPLTSAYGQYHHHGHGHGTYTPSYSEPRYTAPTYTPSRQVPQATSHTQPQTTATQRAAAQRAATTQAAQQRAAERAAQVQRHTVDALEQTARDSARNATPASMDSSPNAALERMVQENASRRQQGYDCIVNQTGGMNCYQQPDMNAPVSYNGQPVIRVPEAYSGSLSGGGYNNPAMQDQRNNGPIPQGIWNATEVRERLHGQSHSNVIALQSAPGNDRAGRDNDFLIHGDSTRQPGNGSQGCIIAPRDVRQSLADMIQNGGQVRIESRP